MRYKQRSNLYTIAFYYADCRYLDSHVLDHWIPETKTHLACTVRARCMTASMVTWKKGHIRKNLIKSGEPQRMRGAHSALSIFSISLPEWPNLCIPAPVSLPWVSGSSSLPFLCEFHVRACLVCTRVCLCVHVCAFASITYLAEGLRPDIYWHCRSSTLPLL